MHATIDVGSNTVRLLIGEYRDDTLYPVSIQRIISRLAGGISAQNILASESMDRTLAALQVFSQIIKQFNVTSVRVVGTAALRRAINQKQFL